jgi:RNase P/RNase MRP subunit p30
MSELPVLMCASHWAEARALRLLPEIFFCVYRADETQLRRPNRRAPKIASCLQRPESSRKVRTLASLSRRVMAVIAVGPSSDNMRLRKSNWWEISAS